MELETLTMLAKYLDAPANLVTASLVALCYFKIRTIEKACETCRRDKQ